MNSCEASQCAFGSTCVQNSGGFVCLCLPNQTGPRCTEFFNPCSSMPCLNNGTCRSDVVISASLPYVCMCSPGFTGQKCESNIDECISR